MRKPALVAIQLHFMLTMKRLIPIAHGYLDTHRVCATQTFESSFIRVSLDNWDGVSQPLKRMSLGALFVKNQFRAVSINHDTFCDHTLTHVI